MNTGTLERYRLALRYAKAFLNLFWHYLKETDCELYEEAQKFFKNRAKTCFLLNLGLFSPTLKHEALNLMRCELKLPPIFNKLFVLLIEHGRSELFELFFKALIQELQARREEAHFVVHYTGTGGLEDAQKNLIVNFLERKTEKKVLCSYKQNDLLIAGLRLQSEQFLWDISVQARLNRIRCSLKR